MKCIIFTRKDQVKKKTGLNTKDIQKFDQKKLGLPDDYEYESEDEEKTTKW